MTFLILWPMIFVGHNWWLFRVRPSYPRDVDGALSFLIGNALLGVSFFVSAIILQVLLSVIDRRLRRKTADAGVG